jgi:hypothetical protein
MGDLAQLTGHDVALAVAANWRQVTQMFAALLTPLIALLTVYIAYQQYRTARTLLKVHLYERRAEILRGVSAALAGVFREGKVPGETIPELLRATSEKEYLLHQDLSEYLDQVYRKVVRGYTVYHEFKDLPVGEKRDRLVSEQSEILLWIHDQPAELRRRFSTYLGFAEEKI